MKVEALKIQKMFYLKLSIIVFSRYLDLYILYIKKIKKLFFEAAVFAFFDNKLALQNFLWD
jgi:hypothetical protein